MYVHDMLSVLIKNGKKTREETPSHDSGIHQMGSIIFGSQEFTNSKPSSSIDEDEEGIIQRGINFLKKKSYRYNPKSTILFQM